MDNIEIIKVGLADIESLQKIAKQTFFETFAASNAEADMQKYLDEKFTISNLTAEVANPDSQFYFASFNNVIIGYLKINQGKAQTEWHDFNALEIERIYVLNAFHGKKIGQYLYDKALEIAQKSKVEYLWLGVWEHNPRAINFYAKNGFVEFDKHIFKLGDDEQTDIMMRLKL
jgi:diamine N-acetyltransferase